MPAIRSFLARDLRNHLGLVGSLSQGRQPDLHAAQPVVKVRAERACFGHAAEIAMGRADQPDIDRHGLQRAERPHLAIFKHAQEPGLQCDRHVADLIEEQRAAVSLHD